jgi:hypothetical protein
MLDVLSRLEADAVGCFQLPGPARPESAGEAGLLRGRGEMLDD